MNTVPPKIVLSSDRSRDYYEVLGVSRNASQDELKIAYREAARRYHPDKGGNPEMFKELAQAYAVLRDPERRQLYNFYRQDIVRTVKVSLEDLYTGASKKQYFSRIEKCSKCNSKGSKSGVPIMICPACRGLGVRPFTRHFIPGSQCWCYQCKGTGETFLETIKDEERCEQCKGEKVVKKKVEKEVRVEKGMQNGQKITFNRNEFTTKKGGGCTYILQQEEHPTFKRKGDDLFVEHTLSFTDALFGGFQFGLTHLDKRQLIIKSKPGEVVKSGQFKVINDEGMPVYQRPSTKGKLYIHFTVEFPDDPCKFNEAVRAPRPSPQVTDMEGEGKETTLHDVNQQQAQEAYDDMHREMMKMKDMSGEGAMRKKKTTLQVVDPQQAAKRKRETILHDVHGKIEMLRTLSKEAYDNMQGAMMKMEEKEGAKRRRVQRNSPYAPMSPPRDNWEDGNPGSWRSRPQYQPYEAPRPGSGWPSTPGGSYSDAGRPRDSGSAYGVDGEGPWLIPDILVNVRHASAVGVIREVLPDGACIIGTGGDMMITAHPSEIELVAPKKSDRIKIMGGPLRGSTGKLIGVDGTYGIVELDDTLEVKIVDMTILAIAEP